MLSGKARKVLSGQDSGASARRNQLSLTKIERLCADEQFQNAKARETEAFDAAVSQSAVESSIDMYNNDVGKTFMTLLVHFEPTYNIIPTTCNM
jgi:hypothetical protein